MYLPTKKDELGCLPAKVEFAGVGADAFVGGDRLRAVEKLIIHQINQIGYVTIGAVAVRVD